jgi:glycosyltransferase involved in cell wall biosynthesis
LRTIVLFTTSYPYDIALENTFLEEELLYLNKNFKIILIPQLKKGRKSNFIQSLNNVEVWEDLPDFSKKYLFNIFDITFFKEFLKIKNLLHLKHLISHYAKFKHIYPYLNKKFIENTLREDFIYYTFWFDSSTTALVSLKYKYNFKLLTRVHGGDLYFERNNNYIPFRYKNIRKIDKIVAVSQQAYSYLENRYNLKKEKIELYHLLSKDTKIINPINETNTFKILSCALVSPLKRIDKIIQILELFSKKYTITVEYTHIGNGLDFKKIQNLSKTYENTLYKINLLGFKTIDEIINIYKNSSFDYFITLSETEGGVPFSLREAASSEIPLIGTRVGGIPEIIINNHNGWLVDKNFTDTELLITLKEAYDFKHKKEYLAFRKKSRKIFLEKFEASNNYQKFIDFLTRM